MKDADVDEHRGDDSLPLAIEQNCTCVVSAPAQELLVGWIEGIHMGERHGQKHRAVDADQKIGCARRGPRAARASHRRTLLRRDLLRWRAFPRILSRLGGQYLGIGRRWITGHDSTLSV